MKANELRIGNYVNEYGIPNQILPNHILKLHQIEVALKICIDITPIPLTEEWLVKFGGILQPWGWIINDILIRFSKHPKEKYWIELGNGKRIELPYVHTIQNFFALTGKELKSSNEKLDI